MLLFPGYNVVVVAAEDKFGNRSEERLEFVVTLPLAQHDNEKEIRN